MIIMDMYWTSPSLVTMEMLLNLFASGVEMKLDN